MFSSWSHQAPLGTESNTTSSNDEHTEGDTTPTKQNPSLQTGQLSTVATSEQNQENQVSSQQNVKPVLKQTNEWSHDLRSTTIKAVILSCWDNTVGPKTLRIWHGMVCRYENTML
jgi:hypothetical protein